MATDFLLIGATGMQGSIVTRDLVEHGYSVAASAKSLDHLEKLNARFPTISIHQLDLHDAEAIAALVKKLQPKVVINTAEGDWNLAVFEAALQGGAHVIDLGSEIPMTEEQLALDADFKEKNLVGVTGIGSTPGVTNIMLAHGVKEFDHIDTIEAGFAWTSNITQFVVPFSMESIVEEFTDPAVFVENGEWTERVPMTTLHENTFREVGPQKVFMVRHPEPYTYYRYFKDTGAKNFRFFAGFPHHSFDVISQYTHDAEARARKVAVVDGREIPLIQLTDVLAEKYPPPPGYEEKENLWVNIEGSKDGQPHKVLLECIVPTLPDWPEAGCNIDTGLPTAILGMMLFEGRITTPGSFAPEGVVPPEEFFQELEKRGMKILKNGEPLL